MLDRRDPHLTIRRQFLRDVMQHEIVRFRGPGRPHDVQRIATEDRRQLLPRLRQSPISSAAEPMRTGRIPDELRRRLHPRVPRGHAQRRGGIMIEVVHGFLGWLSQLASLGDTANNRVCACRA